MLLRSMAQTGTRPAKAKLHFMSASHPAHAVRLMLDHKGIPYELRHLLPGLHPLLIRLRGFSGSTIPALEIDGARLQRSVHISRELDRLQPDPPLFPSDPDERRRVEEAEAWGDSELQDYSRRIFRWSAASQGPVLRELTRRAGFPAADAIYRLNQPVAWYSARTGNATEARVRTTLEGLPAAFDRVDELIAAGTIGADRPNAATFQIGASVRAFSIYDQLWPQIEQRPAGRMAVELLPKWIDPVPAELPAAWLPDW